MRHGAPTTGPLIDDVPGDVRRRDGRLELVLRLAPLLLIIPPLVAFVLADPPAERIAGLLPAFVAFVTIFLWMALGSLELVSRRAPVATVLVTVLAVIIVVIDPQPHWLILFFYPAAAAGLIPSVRRALFAVVAVSIITAAASWLVLDDVLDRFERPLECLLVGLAILAVSRFVVVNRQLVLARAEIAQFAAGTERMRIARDLHDLLGHGLSVISLKAQLAGRLLPIDATRAAVEVGEIEQVSRRALEDVRAAVGGYRRLTFDSELVGARVALETAGVATEVDHQAGSLPTAIDETFAWSVREGATNVVRHAQARRTFIRTRQRDGSAALEIVNDGPEPGSEASQPTTVATGSGLAGLTERARAIGGRVEAGPLPTGGFRLAVFCPLDAGGG